jgi:large repetitive protein
VTNTATVTSTTPDSDPTNNDSTAFKPIGVEANVRVQKDAPTAPVLQGTSFDYTIHVDNAGASAATGVTMSDPLPAGVTFENVNTDLGSCSESGGTVDCSFGTMQPGDSAEVTVRVHADDVGTWTNTATVATPSVESTTADNDDDADVEIVPTADLGVTKSAPPTADPGAQIDYQLGVTNNGPSDATGVSLSDPLPAGVQFVSADPDCSEASGTVTCAVGDLAVGASRSFTVTVAVPYALGGQTLTNSVAVHGNEGDLDTTNDTAQAQTVVGPAADLSITKTSNGATAGGTASWTLVVRNDGPSTGDPVTVEDSLPAGTTFQSATPSQGSCGASGSDVHCNLGAIPAGGGAQIQVVAGVDAGTEGQDLRNRATVTAPQPDPDPSNNASEAVVKVVAPAPNGPNLSLTKTASDETPQLGLPFSYKLIVRNDGDRMARKVRVVDTPSKAVEVKWVKSSKGSCERDGSQVKCDLGTVAAGARASVTVRVVPVSPGSLRNTASVATSGKALDVHPRDNGDQARVRVMTPKARWSLSKTASRSVARGGDSIRFAISVRARGRAISRARICDPLPDGLVFVNARGASFHNGRACWTLRYLAPGAKRTVHVVARAERGFRARMVRNVAVARALNAVRRKDAARVRIEPAFGGAGGGVTG